MDNLSHQEEAIELLQELGLKEYEAKSFVALTRVPEATAKEISDISEVPRTRVYDAIRVLETKGLVEVRHSNPQQFRAVSIDEAVATLRSEYEDRTDSLRTALEGLEPAPLNEEREVTQEVWTLAGANAIRNRTRRLLEETDDELVMVVGHQSIFSEELAETLQAAQQRDVAVIVGAISEPLREEIAEGLAGVEVFVSGLEWLGQSVHPDDDTEIGRILLTDRESILVSTFHESDRHGPRDEQAVFAGGVDNGFVTIVRRIMTTGFLSPDASETD